MSRGSLYVGHPFVQLRDGALARPIEAASHRGTIAPDEHGVILSRGSLYVSQPFLQLRKIARTIAPVQLRKGALTTQIPAAESHRGAIAPDEHGMASPHIHH